MSPTMGLAIVLLILVGYLLGAFKFASSHERIVVLRLGRIAGVRGPGFTFIIPPFEKALRVDLREDAIDLDQLMLKTSDGRNVACSGKISWKVVDPAKSVAQVYAIPYMVKLFTEKCFASAKSGAPFGELAIHRNDLAKKLAAALQDEFASLGLELVCEISDVRSA